MLIFIYMVTLAILEFVLYIYLHGYARYLRVRAVNRVRALGGNRRFAARITARVNRCIGLLTALVR